MDGSNLPRVPVRFIADNQELLKSQEGPHSAGHTTDYVQTEPVTYGAVNTATYRTPVDRVSGNEFFRRYVNGALDLEYAKHKVLDALDRVRRSGGVDCLNSEEKAILCTMFPYQFPDDYGVVSTVVTVQMRISMFEVEAIRNLVARHLAEVMNWNAGYGGGYQPGGDKPEF